MKNLGLKSGTVKVLPHQFTWHTNFEKEKELILSIKSKYIKDIKHVGSTSIPNMPVKPIIDIIIGIDNFYNASKLIKSLAKIGYEFRLKPRKSQLLFIKKDGNLETHYLKILRYKGNYWNKYMSFRETLMNNKKAFEQYKKIKLELEKSHKDNRAEYTKNKNNLLRKIKELENYIS